MQVKIRVRSGTSEEWAAKDPVLLLAEPGYDTTTRTLRVGDGSSKWSELPTTVTTDQIEEAIADSAAVHHGIHAASHATGGVDPITPADIGAAPATHPMLVQAEVTLASWDAAGTVTGTLPSGVTPIGGQAGFVRFTRQGQTASLHVLQANVTGAVPIPTGYRPAFHQRVPAVGPTGTFAAASISAANSAFIMNGAYNAAQYATTTSWLCAPTPLPA